MSPPPPAPWPASSTVGSPAAPSTETEVTAMAGIDTTLLAALAHPGPKK